MDIDKFVYDKYSGKEQFKADCSFIFKVLCLSNCNFRHIKTTSKDQFVREVGSNWFRHLSINKE